MSFPSSQQESSSYSISDETLRLERWIRQNSVYVYRLVALLCLAVLIVYFLPALARSDVYTNDLRQHVAWYYSVRDTALFQDDLLKEYYAGTFTPLGYRALYTVAATLIDPQIFGELLAFLLAIAVILLAYAIGRTVTQKSHLGGIVGILVFLLGDSLQIAELMPVLAGGLQRSFGVPIMLLGVWAILCRNFRVLSLAILLSALFYPPVFISLAMYSGLIIFFWVIRRQISLAASARNLLLVSASIALALGILLWIRQAAGTWTLYSLAEAIRMPEYYPGGVFPWAPVFFDNWQTYVTQAIPVLSVFFWVTVGVFLWRSQQFRAEALILLLSSLINYTIAYLLLFKLYEPIRYITFAQFAFWLIVIPPVALELIHWIERRGASVFSRTIGEETQEFIREFGTLAIVAMLIAASASLTFSRIAAGAGGFTGTAPTEVYEYLKTLPKDTKIAAHPNDAGDIPMRSQRSVLVMTVALSPYHKEFYEEMKGRTAAVWAALYAPTAQQVLAPRAQYGADVLLVNRQWYEQDPFPFQPLNQVAQRYQSALGDREPAVLSLPEAVILFESGSFSVIDLQQLEKLQAASVQS
jgi:hypothetical protein